MAALTNVGSIDFTIYRGDTSDIVYTSPSTLDGAAMDGNWTCSSCVVDRSGDKVISDFSITTKTGDNTEFICYLTPTQTDNLAVTGDVSYYTWVIQLANATTTPPFSKEVHYTLAVKEGRI